METININGIEYTKVDPNQDKSQCIIYFPQAQKFLDLRATESKDLELTKQIWDLIKKHKNIVDIHFVQKLATLVK